MQPRKYIQKKPKRRKAQRLNKAALCCNTERAYRIGEKTAKRIFVNIRLSIDRRRARQLFELCRFFGYSASDTARQAVRFANAETFNEKAQLLAKYEAKGERIIRAARGYEPKRAHYLRQRQPGKCELWARAEGSTLAKSRLILNLTLHDLAEISTEAAELSARSWRELNGTNEAGEQRSLPPSVSAAFRRLIGDFLTIATRLKRAIETRAGIKDLESLPYLKPTKARQSRTRKETRQKTIDRETKAGL